VVNARMIRCTAGVKRFMIRGDCWRAGRGAAVRGAGRSDCEEDDAPAGGSRRKVNGSGDGEKVGR
jgi:hypothetical protein